MNKSYRPIVPSSARQYYERVVYWNDFQQVQRWLNKLITGSENATWMDYVAQRFGQCDTALSLNCGNGWVEQDLARRKIINAVIGIDISEKLLTEATSAAQSLGLRATYVAQDVNTINLSSFSFDWAINHAALHHVANIDHVVRELCIRLPADGILINYDYIGPHRNQYSFDVWQRLIELNELAPERFRIRLDYPHLTTMLHVDPTEAIHSELIVKTWNRYFESIEEKPLGGAIAYPLLYQNVALHAEAESVEAKAWIDRILREDNEYTAGSLDRSLFAFVVGRPLKQVLNDRSKLELWSEEERAREMQAEQRNGRYYDRHALEIIYDQLYALKDQCKPPSFN